MEQLYDKLGVDKKQRTLTMQQPKQKVYNSVSNNGIQEKNYNFMMDLLMLPMTKQKYRYLLVVVDLASNNFDMQELKEKTPDAVLDGYQKIIKRPYIKLAKGSIRTDSGTEFKAIFHKFVEDNNIYHRVASPNRHKQMGVVENLNKTLAKLLMGYIVHVEEKTKKIFNEWVDVLPIIRKDLNKLREVKLDKDDIMAFTDIFTPQKFRIGDYVYEKLDVPEDALGKKQNTNNVRSGDYTYSRHAKRIVHVSYMNDDPPHRYILEGKGNVSYSDNELIKKETTKRMIKQILFREIIQGEPHCMVWMEGEIKRKAVYEPEKDIRYNKRGDIWVEN